MIGSRTALVAGLVTGVLIASLLLAGSGSVVAAEYYNNSSGVVQPDAPQNATLENIVGLAVDLSPDLIGAGQQDPSGSGFQGVLLTGVAFAGVSVGAMAGTGLGIVGGSVLGLAVSYGLVDAGFAPPWVKPLLLFGLGTIVFIAIRKTLQGR